MLHEARTGTEVNHLHVKKSYEFWKGREKMDQENNIGKKTHHLQRHFSANMSLSHGQTQLWAEPACGVPWLPNLI